MTERITSSFDRRSGIDRRFFSYAYHIPERRSAKDRRVFGDRRKDRTKTAQRSSTRRGLYSFDWDLLV